MNEPNPPFSLLATTAAPKIADGDDDSQGRPLIFHFVLLLFPHSNV